MDKFRIHLKRCSTVLKEKGGGKLITLPDDSLTVQQIIEKYARGIVLPMQKQPVWGEDSFDSDDLMEITNMDIADKDDYVKNVKTLKITAETAIKQHKEDLKKQKQKDDELRKKKENDAQGTT